MEGIEAICFDVFGTLVDWRGSLTRECAAVAPPGVDPDAMARRWAALYADGVREPDWRPLTVILGRAGYRVIGEFGVTGLSAAQTVRFAQAWARLDPWPDTIPAMRRLEAAGRRLYPLSNADGPMSLEIAARAGLPWNGILDPSSAVRAYKPDPEVYRYALRRLSLPGESVLMAAAHLFDLEGAKACGFRTAFIRRPGEERDDPGEAPYVDLIADGLAGLADVLAG